MIANSIKSIFKEKCNIQIYEESGIKEAVCEEDIFIEQYTYALNARISIDKLRKDVPLDSQWADEAKKQNRLIKNTHETLEQAKKPRNSSFSQESFNQFKKKRNHVFLKRRVDQLCPDPEYSEKNDYFKCRKT